MQLVLIAIIYFTVVRRLPCSLIIYLLWPRRANVCVSLRRAVTKDKCDAAAVPAPFRTFKKKTGTSAKKTEENQQKTWQLESEHGVSGGLVEASAVSIMEEWAVALTWGFIRWVDSGAFCGRHARPLGLRLTSRYGGSPRYSAKARTVRSSRWSNGKKVHRSQVFTLLYPIADEGEARWVKKIKNHAWVFLPSKRHRLSVAGGSSKELLAHQIQQTKPQNKNLQFETLYPVTPVQLWWSCF